MRLSLGTVANLAAWGVIGLLACAAVVLVMLLGPLGLVLLGTGAWFVCSQARLDAAVPAWGVRPAAAAARAQSPEDRAATAAEREAEAGSLRFFARLRMVLAAAGVALLGWQVWAP